MLQVMAVVGKHGARCLRDIGGRLVRGRQAGPTASQVLADQLRDTLAELGPTFIKLGQVLSTRPDLVPPTLEAALSALQDSAPTVAFEAVKTSVHTEFGADPDVVFCCLGRQPLAAASIGQVHPATLHDGRDVVVKVRRPGIEALIELDLAILRRLAHLAAAVPGPARQFDVVGFVEEFGETIRAELDYLAEGGNAEPARPSSPPWACMSRKSYGPPRRRACSRWRGFYGAKVDDLPALDAMGTDRARLARTLAHAYLSMVFVDGFFHADPHPGNLFVEADGHLAMVDFGMMGTVAPGVRHALVAILVALSTRDMQGSQWALRELGIVPAGVDKQEFSDELASLTSATVDVPLGELRLAPLLSRFMSVVRRYRLRVPRELALLMKTIVMCESLAAQLDPAFSLAPVLAPFVGMAFGTTETAAVEGLNSARLASDSTGGLGTPSCPPSGAGARCREVDPRAVAPQCPAPEK